MSDQAITTNFTIVQIAEELSAIDLSTVEQPKPCKKCEHYRELGPADDHLKRIWALRSMHVTRLQELLRTHDGVVAQYRAAPRGSSEERRLLAEIETHRIAANQAHQVYTIIETLAQIDTSRQFPELLNMDNGHVIIDENWVVGYADHSGLDMGLAELFRGAVLLPDVDTMVALLRRGQERGAGRSGRPI